MNDIDQAIHDLKAVLEDVHGLISLKKQSEIADIMNRLNFPVSKKVLFEENI